MISSKTKACCLIGDPVEHSLSPLMFNSAFMEIGMDCAYLALLVRRGALRAAIDGIRGLGFVGCNVTIPHKVEALKFLDRLDASAELSGSVNVIQNVDGNLVGHSTDGHGAIKALEAAGVALSGMRVLVIGYGGAARAVAFGLAMDGRASGIIIAGRDFAKASSLAREVSRLISAEATDPQHASAAGADLVINCTPVGMWPNAGQSPVPPETFEGAVAAMDLVYKPRETRFLLGAKEKGCKAISGLEVLLWQGAKAFEIWFGRQAPIGAMRRAIEEGSR